MAAAPAGGLSLFEHFYRWLLVTAPWRLDELHHSMMTRTARHALAGFLRGGVRNMLYASPFHNAAPWWQWSPAVADVLRRWIRYLASGPDQVCWWSPTAGWQPISPEQFLSVLPQHLVGADLLAALAPLLLAVVDGVFEIGGEPHHVRVFPRQAQQPADPGEMSANPAQKPEQTNLVAAASSTTTKRSRHGPVPGTTNLVEQACEVLVRDHLRPMQEARPNERPDQIVADLLAEKNFRWPGKSTNYEYQRDLLMRVWRKVDRDDGK